MVDLEKPFKKKMKKIARKPEQIKLYKFEYKYDYILKKAEITEQLNFDFYQVSCCSWFYC